MEFPFPTNPKEAGREKLVSFLSLRAGAGASTLACMTALTMSKHTDTAIIDFNYESKVRSYLGFQDLEVSTLSILDINGVKSSDAIYSAAEKHHSGMKVFPGVSPKILDASQIDAQLHFKAVTYLKQVSPLTVAVLGPLYTSSWITAMLSDLICLVVKPDRSNQDAFRETVDFLNRLGCSDRLKIIINQCNYPGSLDLSGIKSYFSPDVIIPYDKAIPSMCNKRVIDPNKELRNTLFTLVKGVENDD